MAIVLHKPAIFNSFLHLVPGTCFWVHAIRGFGWLSCTRYPALVVLTYQESQPVNRAGLYVANSDRILIGSSTQGPASHHHKDHAIDSRLQHKNGFPRLFLWNTLNQLRFTVFHQPVNGQPLGWAVCSREDFQDLRLCRSIPKFCKLICIVFIMIET
jgi:hypothetical protein